MIVSWLVLLFILPFIGIRFHFNDMDGFMDVDQTTSIKGFFAALIFLSHVRAYLMIAPDSIDYVFSVIIVGIGQLMVTMYFFYSGYGVFESFKTKPGYDRSFFRNRFLKTLLHFDMAVALYAVLDLILGTGYPGVNYILCWVGWESLGNSNWFIFVILVLYFISFLSFRFTSGMEGNRRRLVVVLINAGLSLVVFFLIRLSVKQDFWYNTLLCYPFGIIFSCFKDDICRILKKGQVFYPLFAVVLAVFVLLHRSEGVVLYNICSCCFCLLTVMVTMKVKISNRLLIWLGKYSFSIYVLQRIPMMILDKAGVSDNMLFILISLTMTVCLSAGFERIVRAVDRRLFRRNVAL